MAANPLEVPCSSAFAISQRNVPGDQLAMPGSVGSGATALDSVAHIIQVALTPVFLLSGIAALLNVFSSRLARVADRVDQLAQALESADPGKAVHLGAQLAYLRRRSLALDLAVVLAALGGGATCGATLALFVGALRDATVASVLFSLFGLAVTCTLGALTAFLVEMLMAGRGLREEVAEQRESARNAAGGSPGPRL
jgi:hypothetical protein